MLVELRRKLDKVARHLRARQAGIHGIGKHAVQRVAELVKHRGHIVKAEQRRLPRRGLLEVGHVVDHRQRAQQLRLAHQRIHPRSAVLVVALEVVAIPQRQRLSIRIENLKHAHVRLLHRNVVPLLEGEPVELVRRIEHAVLEHVVQLEVGLDLRFVQVVLRLAHLLGVELPVPRLEREAAVPAESISAWMSFAFARRLGRRRRHQRIQKMNRRLRRLGHLVGQIPRRVIRIAQQRGLLRAQLRQPRNRRARVVARRRARRGSRSSQRSLGACRDRSDNVRSGCCVVFCSGISQPCCLCAFAASAAAAICASLSPASALRSRRRVRARLGGGQQLGHERVFERRIFFVELFQLRLCRRRKDSRRPSQTAGSRTPPAAAIPDRDAAMRACHRSP